MRGGFDIVCARDSSGRSAIARQYVSAPMHISKPWWDGSLLIVNAVNSTAGLFSGDDIEMRVEVRAGAEMLLTSPSATRVHRMLSGRAEVRQQVCVEGGGWLEMLPALFIPHAGSDYLQVVNIDLAPGARCLCFETFAPGRVASGEAWEFSRFETRFQLSSGGRLIARDTYTLTPDSPSVAAIRHHFPAACHSSVYAVGAQFSDDLLSTISSLHHSHCWVGCTRLDAPAVAVRAVASDNVQLARTMASIRLLLYQSFNRKVPALRRA